MDPDPTPGPTSNFINCKDAKKNFSHFFLITCQQVHHRQSKKFKFLLKFCVEILLCKHYFSQLNTFMRNWKDPETDL